MKLPLIPLRNVVVYPDAVLPLLVGRTRSLQAVRAAQEVQKRVVLVAQKDAKKDDPGPKDIYDVATISEILQLISTADGSMKMIVEGCDRARIAKVELHSDGYYEADVTLLSSVLDDEEDEKVLISTFLSVFEQYCTLSNRVTDEVRSTIMDLEDASNLADVTASQLELPLSENQKILAIADVRKRMEFLMSLMQRDIDTASAESRIRGRVRDQMEKSQREYYLNEKMKAIQKELRGAESGGDYLETMDLKIRKSGMPKEVREKMLYELGKLKMMSPLSAEASVVRSYIDWMVSVPWKKRNKVRYDLAHAMEILDQDHYGLEDVKDRILEYLAVHKRVKTLKGPVLCLVGPPGVGKTSLGESIARATNRRFIRMALGGMRDEAEIRGHRRTYIGSLPGRIMQKMVKAGVRNPLFLLDELDKMGVDYRGDPASALLEVLDPEQNRNFSDHYLEVEYDLSEVMFVCTANTMNIPEPLLDRMETIRLPGYTEEEKLNIAERYLATKQKKNHGIEGPQENLSFAREGLRELIRYYTREAGVRGLEREIAKITRKVVRELSEQPEHPSKPVEISITPEKLEHYCGVQKYTFAQPASKGSIGQVNCLAWTPEGGELLNVEAVLMPGSGKYLKTGSLGDVMQESVQAASSVVRSRSEAMGLLRDLHSKYDIHVHVPEGATKKDGPSAGVGICTAIVSILTKIAVRSDVAMTGEITLRGEVLRIGGLKEKVLAAHRACIDTVILPQENERDLKDIPEDVKKDLCFKPVKWIDEVLEIALERMPQGVGKYRISGQALAEGKKLASRKGISTH